MMPLSTFIVLYRGAGHRPADPPCLFRCEAEDSDHAEEQCQDAEPEAEVLWVVATKRPEVALTDYYAGWEAEPLPSTRQLTATERAVLRGMLP